MIARGGLSGLAGGFILGFLLKWIQAATGIKVYTLLLNIDFIYPKPLPEWVEFAIHLVVAVFIGIGYVYLSSRLKIQGFGKRFAFALILTLPALLLYFPLSLLAIKDVPGVWDVTAFGYWCLGHLGFVGGMVLLGGRNRK
ncbi:hypothetical protein GKZ89_04115 [Bacillus mangrovi]|uniref:DUF1440 domain-containing protein n=1 Tax=Metabacillus mangrovi TaxID=1491830 RepID=A0A7X2S395_9BACI|nr:hypothetical protein [Metabacillus mangrovi]MTH52582.1 hypothetical protein [Metabacillus mangrovi]